MFAAGAGGYNRRDDNGVRKQDLMVQRRRIMVEGQVQGVGFRPFVHHLAGRLDLTGHVANTTDGAVIEVQGEAELLDRFIKLLVREAPRLARPVVARVRPVVVAEGERGFAITASVTANDNNRLPDAADTENLKIRGQDARVTEERKALVTPDAATCPDCLQEMNDPCLLYTSPSPRD